MSGSVTTEWTVPGTGFCVRNRTVLAAMTNKQSQEDGTLSDDEINWLLRRAEGGFGIVTTAASHVHPSGKSWEGEMGVWGDHQIPRLKELAEGIRERGAASLVQVFHGGLRAPRSLTGEQPVSASTNLEKGVEEGCRELSDSEIRALVVSFGEAAERCEKAGFDGVEIHGAHGYLICQFLGTRTNRRDDRWGGGLEGRSLFLREVLSEIRSRTSEGFLVSVRISPEHDVGVTMADSLDLAGMMGEWGMDLLHISCWDAFTGAQGDPDDPRTITRRFREALGDGVSIISTGAVWDGEDAQFVLDEGADLVGVARVAIAHSSWASEMGAEGYSPERPPFTPEHLIEQGLSQTFVDYMRRWKGFVTDGRL
ncbi:MAG: NADH:flavin oxidoreductase [Candidatus Thalassarchaeaceae archaeon]